ncbi:transglutaminase domain-containing protein [Methanobrevibacter sp. DSM 116169]|uniref:transglutaminase domain-containing protein n=1 Tax=Methanobrevibacter sp. DSM 116169 TaxID=3242727 RepID=UPI0038FD3E98
MKKNMFKILIFFSVFLLVVSIASASNETITLDSDENSNLIKDTIEEDVSINSAKSTIKSSDLKKYYKNDSQFEATFYNQYYAPLANTDVKININNQEYIRTTNSKGVLNFNINLVPGNYSIKLTNPSDGSTATNNIQVLSNLNGNDITKFYKNGTQYYISVLDGQGKPITNTAVEMNINGIMYYRNTDSNGRAMLSINLDPNTYILTAIHPTNKLEMSNIITVLPTIMGEDLAKFFLQSEAYTVKIVDGQGKIIKNTVVEMNINGVLYKRSTNSNGIASLNINLDPGSYIITVAHNGLQRSNIIQVYHYVADNLNNVLITPITKYIQKEEKYQVKLTQDNGLPLINKNIQITINNSNYNAYTNDQGIASIDLKLNPGTYDVKVKFEETGISRELIVTGLNKGIETLLTPLTTVISKDETFDVKLTNKNTGNGLANQEIVFYINGKEYVKTTDNNGIASLNVDFKISKVYPIAISFAGESYKTISTYKLVYFVNSITDLKYNYPTYPDNVTSNYWINPPNKDYPESDETSCLNNNYIKALSSLLTKFDDSLENIIAINNYVGSINYKDYTGTEKDAVATLLSFEGNCIGQSAVFISLARNANFPTRYIVGEARYEEVGHMWGQFLIDNIWICFDVSAVVFWEDTNEFKNAEANKYLGNKEYLYDGSYNINYAATFYKNGAFRT